MITRRALYHRWRRYQTTSVGYPLLLVVALAGLWIVGMGHPLVLLAGLTALGVHWVLTAD